jgi:hypothetical protein
MLIALLSSCEEPVVSDPPDDIVATGLIGRPLGRLEFAGAEAYRGNSDAAWHARLELLGAVMDRFKVFRSTLKAVADGKVDRQELEVRLSPPGLSEAERWFFEQMAATLVLEAMLGVTDAPEDLPGPSVNWDAALLGKSVDILLAHRSPNAPLLARAIGRMSGRWTESEISSAASRASKHAIEWLQQECGPCGQGLVPAGERQPRFSIDVVKMQKGVEELMQIALDGGRHR